MDKRYSIVYLWSNTHSIYHPKARPLLPMWAWAQKMFPLPWFRAVASVALLQPAAIGPYWVARSGQLFFFLQSRTIFANKMLFPNISISEFLCCLYYFEFENSNIARTLAIAYNCHQIDPHVIPISCPESRLGTILV